MLNKIASFFAGSASASDRDPYDDKWWGGTGAAWAGEPVSMDGAMQLPVLLDGVQAIATAIASLPLQVFERMPNSQRKRASFNPLEYVLNVQANAEQTAYEFRELMISRAVLYRAAYAAILPGPRGPVDQLIPLHPAYVRAFRNGGQVWFDVTDPNWDGPRVLRSDEVFKIRRGPYDGDGLNPLPLTVTGRQCLSKAMALAKYAASFFRDGRGSGGVISFTEGWFKSTEEADKFLAWFDKKTRSAKHKDVALPHNAKWTPRGAKNNEAQFIETFRESNLDLCRLIDVPPHKVKILDQAHFSNIEQQALEWVSDTLLPYIIGWEKAVARDLILNPARFFAAHNFAALLRGDLKTRYEAYAIGRQWGWLSRNDIRALENMNSIPGGDDYLSPLNMVPLGTNPATAQAESMAQSMASLLDERDQQSGCGQAPRRLKAIGA